MQKSSWFDLFMGVFSQVLLVGSGLIMLPFAVMKLSAPEIAVWYIFLTIQAMVFLLDFGATDTFIRFFSYVFAGASELTEVDVPKRSKTGEVDIALLAVLMRTAQKIYFYMTGAAAVVMLVAGTAYIHATTKGADLSAAVWPAWGIFVVTMLAQTYFQWQSAPLIGSGRARRNYEIAVRSRLTQVLISVVGLYIYPSLLVMCIGFAISALVMRIDYHYALRPIRAKIHNAPITDRHANLGGVIFRSARRLGGTTIGALMTSRLVALCVAWYAGLAVSAQFSIATQALVAMTSISSVVLTTIGPRIAKAGVSSDQEALRSLFSFSLFFGWLVYIAGGIGLVFVVPFILTTIGSNTTLPPSPILIGMLVLYCLEMNMFTATRMITTTNNSVPYWRAMLVTGAVTMIAVITAGQLGFGLPGILICQLCIQLAYNYWRWPVYCFKLLNLSPGAVPRYVRSGMREVLGW